MQAIITKDPKIAEAIFQENRRQVTKLELIASENFVSEAVREAQGSVLTHKYAEGYPRKRYYGGCEYVDIAEEIAIDRAKEIFSCNYVNVQPHSGSQANMAAYLALANVGDTVLGMNLSHGGHLTHGSPVNFSGKLFNIISYGVTEEGGLIDYDAMEKLAHEHKPKVIIAGASAYSRIIDFARFRKVADAVGAKLLVDMAHIAGLVAAGLHPSPIDYAHITTTTTHKTLRGPRGGMILANSTEEENIGKTINSQIFPGIQGGPLMHIIAAKAISFGEALHPSYKEYQQQVINNAAYLAKLLMQAGYSIVSGGTDNHLMLLDLTNKDITGKDAEHALDRAGITVNKNTVPFETRSPFVTSGIRIGTPALTTRGMKEKEMEVVGGFIVETLKNINSESKLDQINKAVADFAEKYPLFAY